MFKNLFVIALMIAACTALPYGRVSIIGNILTKGLSKVRYLGSESVHVKNTIQGNRVIFKFPQNPSNEDVVIRGIKTVHNSLESKMQILDGGIGKNQVTIAVTLPEKADTDTDTEFYFYGDVVKSETNAEAKPKAQTSVFDAVKAEYTKYKNSQQSQGTKLPSSFEAIRKEYEEFKKFQEQEHENELAQKPIPTSFEAIRKEYEDFKKFQEEEHKKELEEANANELVQKPLPTSFQAIRNAYEKFKKFQVEEHKKELEQ